MKTAKNLFLMILVFLSIQNSFAQQENNTDYRASYEKGNYEQSLRMIHKRLKSIYDKGIDKKINAKAYTTEKSRPDNESLDQYYENKRLFVNRKVRGFLIKEDNELAQLHFYAARCYFQLKNYKYALNNYIQSLRYKKLEKKDHIVFFEIGQVYKKLPDEENASAYNAYLDSLETAYSLSPTTALYAFELGREMYFTRQKNKSIFYLEKYISMESNVTPTVYILLGNLYEQTGYYLRAEQNYALYLEKSKNYTGVDKLTFPSGKEIQPGYVYFSLGFIAYKHTGNHRLAIEAFKNALKQLPDDEIYRKSKAHEFMGDIALSDLRYSDAVSYYLETINYQNKIITKIDKKKLEIQKVELEIQDLKAFLLNQQDPDKFNNYQDKLREKGDLETELYRLLGEYKKLSPGKIRWNIAGSLEKVEKYKAAVKYYNEAISFGFKSKKAREKIEKLELKINRGW